MKISLVDIEDAKRVLGKILEPTPMLYNRWLSEKFDCEVYLKLENMQPVGSFKIRGAAYKVSKLDKKSRAKGVITASAGNHAQGLAWSASQFGTKATIVMPTNAPITKIQNAEALGAEVILHGESYEETYAQARKLEKKTGATFVHAFEDESVIAGQGTLALEILDQVPDVDMVIGAIGGGGLMVGVGTVFKALKPDVEIVAAQASGASSMVQSLQKHRIVQTNRADTFADGIKVKHASAAMLKLLEKVVDKTAQADDEKIAGAVLTLMEKGRIISEGAAALTLATLEDMYAKSPIKIKKKKIVLIICGGNIDVNVLSRIIDRGLILAGRRVRLFLSLPDKPGSLQRLTTLIAEHGANILQAIHDRDMPSVLLNETGVEMSIETRGAQHTKELIAALRGRYPNLVVFK